MVARTSPLPVAHGGTVEVADLGNAVPAGSGGLRSMLSDVIAEAGGYEALVERVVGNEPDLT